MKKVTLQRVGICLFCVTLIGGGILTIGPNVKSIAKKTLSGMKSGYAEKSTIEGLLKGTISGIEAGISDAVFAKEAYINLYGLSESLLGKHYIRDTNIAQSVIKDNNGQLQFATNKVDTTPYAEEIGKVNELLEEKDIPFVYVQTPLKVIEGYTELPASVLDYAEINTDTFKGQLEEKGVDVLDLRENVKSSGLDYGTLFYNTDHHWRTQTAFWAVGEVVQYLKETEGIDLDPNHYYTDSSNYEETFYKQNFLGSQGRRVGKYYGGLDDYTLMTPNFDTSYEVTITKTNGSTVAEGTFEEAIIKKNLLNAKSVFTNRYASYFGGDFPEVDIKNKNAENDFKVLIVKDSFALPFSAFFSTMVSETRMLDTRYYEGEVTDYINSYNPDLVLYVYKSINTQK